MELVNINSRGEILTVALEVFMAIGLLSKDCSAEVRRCKSIFTHYRAEEIHKVVDILVDSKAICDYSLLVKYEVDISKIVSPTCLVNYYTILNYYTTLNGGYSGAFTRKEERMHYSLKITDDDEHSSSFGVSVHPDFVHVIDKDTMSLRILDYSAEFEISGRGDRYIINLSKKQMRNFKEKFIDVKPYWSNLRGSSKLTELLQLKPDQFEHIYDLVYSS